MLQKFRVDNFKSLINIAFKPQDINLYEGEEQTFEYALTISPPKNAVL